MTYVIIQAVNISEKIIRLMVNVQKNYPMGEYVNVKHSSLNDFFFVTTKIRTRYHTNGADQYLMQATNRFFTVI